MSIKMITKREILRTAALSAAALATARSLPALAQSDRAAKKGGAVSLFGSNHGTENAG
jgi:hypothetical protein